MKLDNDNRIIYIDDFKLFEKIKTNNNKLTELIHLGILVM